MESSRLFFSRHTASIEDYTSKHNVQDRDGLALVCRRLRRRFPWLRLVLADGGHRGETAARVAAREGLRLEVVTRPAGARGFAVLPRRRPLTGSSLILRGRRSSLVDTAATKGCLPAAPRPRLPGRCPPK